MAQTVLRSFASNCIKFGLKDKLLLNRVQIMAPFARSMNAQSIDANDKFDNDKLTKLVREDKVVVFMKGVPEAPRCGFSNAVVQVLRMHEAPFKSYDVLANEDLRRAIKDFTSWPTIPQIFINGEFIGGCDILLEKHQNGELIEDLLKVGIKSLILEEAQEEKPDDKSK